MTNWKCKSRESFRGIIRYIYILYSSYQNSDTVYLYLYGVVKESNEFLKFSDVFWIFSNFPKCDLYKESETSNLHYLNKFLENEGKEAS